MTDHLERMNEELDQLKERYQKLVDFMHSEKYGQMPAVDQGLMMVQLRFMDGYALALTDRINRTHEVMKDGLEDVIFNDGEVLKYNGMPFIVEGSVKLKGLNENKAVSGGVQKP